MGWYKRSGFRQLGTHKRRRRRPCLYARAGALAAAWLGLTLLVFQSSACGGKGWPVGQGGSD